MLFRNRKREGKTEKTEIINMEYLSLCKIYSVLLVTLQYSQIEKKRGNAKSFFTL